MVKIIQVILAFIKELLMPKDFQYLKEARDKVICRYTLIDPIEKKAEGTMYFNGESYKLISGGAGDGFAPRGKYKAYGDQLKLREEPSYTAFGFGWVLPIGAQFETNRTKLMIHPVRNKTLGCAGIKFVDLDENIKCFNQFRDYFDKTDILNVEIV